ncbi:MAG TPA: phosphate acyltransferase PlsX [Thermoflexales bacterium]|nr:phosphate acyltransferase PlsX [Anaerolineae bacterium]HQV26508.1 phosphate acyltransferase PlsX [Thermoflexales bacterium]HQX08971.1 phosphate acyltransferase PlsX [Thermoflexales bacterium]HQZ51854.1 phosphate acyltransferase PlsX [Thermoflexales bacterium]HRA52039.1 phosphate acyltransferase PlsX [Thermoflexales bacterium]
MKIVLDAMGGDFGPEPNVEAAIQAARAFGHEIVLVGKQDLIRPLLNQHNTAGLMLPIVHANEVVEMDEHPAAAVKAKKDNSMSVGLRLVKSGQADAFVTMGNTGAAMASALFTLGRIKGVHRPAISSAIPTTRGWTFMIDIGANADCRPEYLVQFALMGSIYSERVMQVRNPKVGLLSNGEEESKGSELVQATHQLLKASGLNFIGNVEGRDIPVGTADVIVTDGFTGNVAIKLMEGMKEMIESLLKDAFYSSLPAKIGGALSRTAIKATLKSRTSYEEIGGAPLLGVDGVVIIGHGRSKAPAIFSAIKRATESVQNGVVDAIERGLAAAPQGA